MDELLLESITEIRKVHPSCQIRLDMDHMPLQAGALVLPGSHSLLKIALGNVLENACKFSETETVAVSLQLSDGVIITVADQGMGIPEKELQHIFQPFYRARNARGHSGTGIGLSLTEKIVRLHGGSIKANSVEGKGTTLQLHFKV